MELTHQQLCRRLEREIELDGTLTQAAKVFGVSAAMLSLVLRSKRGIGPKMLKRLGLRKHVTKTVMYEELPKNRRSLKELPAK